MYRLHPLRGGIGWQGQLFPAEEAQKLADLAVEWGDRSGWSEKHGTVELPTTSACTGK